MSERAIIIKNQAIESLSGETDFTFEKTETVEKITAENIENFAYKAFRENLNIFCDLAFKISFVCYGILQFLAISAGILKVFHSNNILTLMISSVLAFLPVVGTICGIFGACIAWGWNIWNAILIFIFPYFIVNGPLLIITFFEIYKDLKRWQSEKKI